MVKMNIHSKYDDLQNSRLNDLFLVADMIRKAGRNARQGFGKFKCKPNPSSGGAQFPTLTSNKDPPFANGSFVLPVQRSHIIPSMSSSPFLGSLLNKEEKNAIRTPKDSAALSNPARCLLPDKIVQAILARSDGGSRKGHPQQSPSKITHLDISMRATTSVTEAIGRPPLSQVLPM
ncbi:unnamed protein product [Sphagnum troendelagicum]|uniref:Uncharacterized protein n=1 Tax=Sphagnum troendelagicum TaxID=128251 RepID=A0ABP0US78_9BRYO